AVRSGTSSVTSAPRPPMDSSNARSCRATAWASLRLAFTAEAVTADAGSGREAARTWPESIRAAAARPDAISTASAGVGGAVSSSKRARSSASKLNEGHLVDFLEGGETGADPVKSAFAQELHPLLPGSAADLRRWSLRQDHLAHRVGHLEQFVDGGAAAEAGAGALHAAAPLEEVAVHPLAVEAAGVQNLFRIAHRVAAGRADQADEPLGQDAVEG